jgi:homoserine O-acetyltransferase
MINPLLDPGLHEYFDLRKFQLTTGYTLSETKLAYKTRGTLNSAKDNAILFPHQYSGTSASMEIFIGKDRPLDPAQYFIILPGQFSNGYSTSPSNTPPPFNHGAFPPVTIADDVIAQHRLVTERFEISELYAVLGWSMGAQQTYEWAVRYPHMVKRAAAFAATAKTPLHSRIFARVTQEALKSDPAWNKGFYDNPNAVQFGLRRHAHAFAFAGVARQFYRDEAWRRIGLASVDDFIGLFFEQPFLAQDPANLLSQTHKWSNADVSVNTGGDLAAALAQITAKMFVVAFKDDLIMPRADCEADAALVPNAQLRFIDSVWGHLTMVCPLEEDKKSIDKVLSEVLASPPGALLH